MSFHVTRTRMIAAFTMWVFNLIVIPIPNMIYNIDTNINRYTHTWKYVKHT